MSSRVDSVVAVFDVNTVISGAITPEGTTGHLLDAWHQRRFRVATSQAIVMDIMTVPERDHIKRRYQLDRASIAAMIELLLENIVEPVPIAALPVYCRDADDDAILAVALAAQADYIVTGDHDLLVLDGHPSLGPLRIVTPRALLNILDSGCAAVLPSR